MEKASDSSTTDAKIMKHSKENIQHFKGIVIIFCDDIIILRALKTAILFSSNFSH
jgi:ribosomal protein L19